MRPRYLALHERGELVRRVEQASAALRHCTICPRACGVDRTAGQRGVCSVGPAATVASAGPHFGEEAPLVGHGGSGTIFFASCNLRCVFCQNYDISQRPTGRSLSARGLGELMVELQELGCHNVNLVTPSHQIPAILAGLVAAIERGLTLPLVYNTSGYDTVDTLAWLDGVVDIYMPDLKTLDREWARVHLRAADYPAVVQQALREMHRQVGDLELAPSGIAERGLLLRHLVMPADGATTRLAMQFVHDELSPRTYVNVMAQWHPAGEARRFAGIDRRLEPGEYEAAVATARALGLERLDR